MQESVPLFLQERAPPLFLVWMAAGLVSWLIVAAIALPVLWAFGIL